MNYSPLQEAIFAAVRDRKASLLVNAKAGSGKTTTMVEAMKYLHSDDRICALAFNKAIANTLQQRVPSYVEARTFNSLGYGAVMQKFKPQMNFKKNFILLKQAVPQNYHDDYLSELTQVMRHGKAWGVGIFEPNGPEVWNQLLALGEFDIDSKIIPRAADWLSKAYEKGLRETKSIDFDDQILFPLYYELSGKRYDVIFVDEAQDLSPLQHEFLKRFLNPSGRIIAVGDPYQAIYAFRGADTHSMQKLGNEFQMDELPLSISYRCSQAVIREAQSIVPDIEAHESAPEGLVDEVPLPEISTFTNEDMVLCRNNAPLVSLGLRFLSANQPVHVRGEFGRQIMHFIEKFKTDDIKLLEKRLEVWYDTEKNMAEQEEKYRKVQSIEEKYSAIKAVLEHSKPASTSELLNVFRRLFDSTIGTTLSSIHRAKGEEAKRVWLLQPGLIPSRYAKTPDQKQQEMNLKYVAITRALEEFHYISD